MRQTVILCLFAAAIANAQKPRKAEETQPQVVTPGGPKRAPSDAVIIFDGTDLSRVEADAGQPARCTMSEGVMACTSGSGNIFSKEKFRDAQLHLEFNIPSMPDQHDQMRGNSGVYLQGRYEIQVLDSYENPTYPNGMLGALYGQAPPLVNAARKPGEWQTYDLVFRAPRCGEDGKVRAKATVTVILNGLLVQDHVPIEASAGGPCEAGPLMLQDHSGFPGAPVTTMKFRNIWLRHLGE